MKELVIKKDSDMVKFLSKYEGYILAVEVLCSTISEFRNDRFIISEIAFHNDGHIDCFNNNNVKMYLEDTDFCKFYMFKTFHEAYEKMREMEGER